MRPFVLTIFLTLLAFAPAIAQEDPESTSPQEQTQEPYRFNPEGCEFEITFPSEPYTARRCDPESPDNCILKTSYTKVEGLDSTIHVTAQCNKATPDMFEDFELEIMEASLAATAKSKNLSEFQTGSRSNDQAKQAILIGMGQVGRNETIFTSQIWIGKKSVLTIEAELIGTPSPETDAAFAGILETIKLSTPDGPDNMAPSPDTKDNTSEE